MNENEDDEDEASGDDTDDGCQPWVVDVASALVYHSILVHGLRFVWLQVQLKSGFEVYKIFWIGKIEKNDF